MQTVRVWDPLVRLFHWTLATACILNLWVLEDGSSWHEWVGYYAGGAIAIRVLWGFIGTPYARFRSFFPTPTRLKNYVGALMSGKPAETVGHNPMGGLMILALMFLVAALAVSGWMMSLDAFWGEDWLEEIHEGLANALMALMLIHIAAVSLYSRFGKENLIAAMVTGKKQIGKPE
ncbi:cytochrome B [Hahella sp. KA22]|uniref:cytochrome b/b6 domain-containing protein n=1 Tax=Hahella sp. KA22 TaxID=1628392 RepID=UPI000FDECCD2|nr:cytochrome b/b6 domain-containing protein [Hahella sp. KA22]AZZ95242.1 cytochrome B [Hahella sp. KA22]QAY52887.1 cytochrome B [Hahella sp. KA22]